MRPLVVSTLVAVILSCASGVFAEIKTRVIATSSRFLGIGLRPPQLCPTTPTLILLRKSLYDIESGRSINYSGDGELVGWSNGAVVATRLPGSTRARSNESMPETLLLRTPDLAPISVVPGISPLKSTAPATRFLVRREVSSSVIWDQDGNAVFTAAPGHIIYGITPEPGGRRVLVYLGDANYVVYDEDTGTTCLLPARINPEVDSGVSKWVWLGTSGRLIGVQKSLRGSHPGCGELEVFSTEAAIFDLKTETLWHLDIPQTIRLSNADPLEGATTDAVLFQCIKVDGQLRPPASVLLGLGTDELIP